MQEQNKIKFDEDFEKKEEEKVITVNKIQHSDIPDREIRDENVVTKKKVLETVSLNLGYGLYTSKQELFSDFFGDFYDYLSVFYPKDLIISKKTVSKEDFLLLASDFDYGSGNLQGFADRFCDHFLTPDRNGVLSSQNDDSFIGFCLGNEKYVNLFNFFSLMFSYWRIDEKCANSKNYGADFLADPWSSLVDICKFFYYDSNTSYVNSQRVLDCLDRFACIISGDLDVYEELGILPSKLSLRGYSFKGWYLNKDYSGSQISDFSNLYGDVVLYAKWEIDGETFFNDLKNRVELSIYNLTTDVAHRNKVTVSYSRLLFDSLPEKYQKEVSNIKTLQKYEKKYKK